jgi:pimeloyl-ACP methyl ester carboxylesterase
MIRIAAAVAVVLLASPQSPAFLTLVDPARERTVPVAVYQQGTPAKPAILSHGYGARNTDYGFIARHLAARGYLVVSIQHELAGDPPLPPTGTPYDTRMPSWKQGAENIRFVVSEMRGRYPGLDYSRLLLVGHSHGGDTSLLFAREYPDLARAVISLDSRRMPFPRTARPRLFTIRSSDQQPDPGVLPSPAERAALGLRVVTLRDTVHNDMWDGATPAQKAEMLRHIDRFLGELEQRPKG